MIATTVKNEGFEGILLPANGRKDKVLIVISGSNGGMKMTRQIAEFYNENTFLRLPWQCSEQKERRKILTEYR